MSSAERRVCSKTSGVETIYHRRRRPNLVPLMAKTTIEGIVDSALCGEAAQGVDYQCCGSALRPVREAALSRADCAWVKHVWGCVAQSSSTCYWRTWRPSAEQRRCARRRFSVPDARDEMEALASDRHWEWMVRIAAG